MKRRIILSLLLTALLASFAPAKTWQIDVPHSSVNFSVRHMVISKATGRFGKFSGSIEFDVDKMQTGSVELTVQMESIDTNDEDRDNHLRSEDFFETAKYPTMTFTSTAVGELKDGTFTLTGDLTIKDVTRSVTFDCDFHGVLEKGPRGIARAGFSAITIINRQDYNITWSRTLDAGGLMLGNDVEISIEIEAVLPKEKTEEKTEEKTKDESEGKE